MSRVYIVSRLGGPRKIGIAADPVKRLVGLQTGSPEPLALEYQATASSSEHAWASSKKLAFVVECGAHSRLRDRHISGEWFNVSLDEALAALDQAARQHGVALEPLPILQEAA